MAGLIDNITETEAVPKLLARMLLCAICALRGIIFDGVLLSTKSSVAFELFLFCYASKYCCNKVVRALNIMQKYKVHF